MSISSCDNAPSTNETLTSNYKINLIPLPQSLELGNGGDFIVNEHTTFRFEGDNKEELIRIGQLFNTRIEKATGYRLSESEKPISNEIILIIDPKFEGSKESYSLKSTKKSIEIRANSPAGLFYGSQTLFQLLPAEIKSPTPITNIVWGIPSVTIKDTPRFEWRGAHLDVSRNFFTKEQVMTYIDRFTEYKMNKLHFHLSDDQGWRLEIKAIPELVEKTAFRPYRIGDWWTVDAVKEGEPNVVGGFYTQDEMREIIAYAAERYVEVIPEFDVPGHSLALMVVYPELHCFGTSKYVNVGNPQEWEVSSLCIGNKKTMEVLKVIYKEVAELFPSQYIHIGGDECGKLNWKKCPKCKALMKQNKLANVEELQSYFVHDMYEYVTSLGKKMIGWDEISEGGLVPGAIVMSWRGLDGGIKAAQAGHQVIMTPSLHCYIDLYQGDPAIEPLTYGRCRLFDSYNWNPVPEGVDEKLVMGGQANLWSEKLTTMRHAEYCMFPRLWALAETYWTPQEKREWNEFFGRVEHHFKRADIAKINHSMSVYNAWVMPFTEKSTGKVFVDIWKELDDVDIYYTLDSTIPDNYSLKYDGKPFEMPGNSSKINIQTYRKGVPCGKLFRVTRDDINRRASRNKK